jgi:hypothetical protein
VAIQLTPDQVPVFWEAIKYGSVNSDKVAEEHRQSYLNRLLYLLLSNNAQCFVRLDKERNLQSICITKIVVDELTGEKGLFIKNVYSFQKFSVELWIEDFEALIKLGKKEGCKTIYGWTTNDQISRLAEAFNLKELTRSYGMEI